MPVTQDRTGSPLSVGDTVSVRCTITAMTNSGSGSRLTLSVDTPGNPGEATGVTLSVSPVQVNRTRGVVSNG